MQRISQFVLSKLSRITSHGGFLPEIDGLRFVAIMSVIIYHLHDYWIKKPVVARYEEGLGRFIEVLALQGWFGVQLFFVISGFILTLPFAAHHLEGRPAVGIKSYFLRRLTRLEPTYLINLLLIFTLLIVVNHASFLGLLPNLGASAIYQHGLLFGTMSTVNFVTWSLEVEVQFYILMPFFSLVFLVKTHWIRVLLLVPAMLFFAFVEKHKLVSGFCLLSHLQYFFAGILLADIYLTTLKNCQAALSWTWDFVAATSWILIVFILVRAEAFTLILPFLIIIAYVGAFRGRLMNRIFRSPWIVTIGGMCYTIYLYHFYIISLIGHGINRFFYGCQPMVAFVAYSLIVIPAIIGIGAILFILFERPFMNKAWPKEFWLSATRQLHFRDRRGRG
ncbi:MAG: acyltransferase [Verrucomicrobiota bacterium]